MKGPSNLLMFAIAVLFLLIGVTNIILPHRGANLFDHYFAIVWFVGAAVFLYRSYKPSRPL